MNSGLILTTNYTFYIIFTEDYSTKIDVKWLIIRLFHNHMKGRNNLFLALKQTVS